MINTRNLTTKLIIAIAVLIVLAMIVRPTEMTYLIVLGHS